MSEFTHLEGVVLSAIRLHQPLSAYALRDRFRRSLTATWSGSAGAIYPLIRRMKERGLLKEDVQEGDKRGTRLLSVTPSGDAALLGWVRDDDDEIFAAVAEPTRSRSYFLFHLEKKDRVQIVALWRERTMSMIGQVETSIDAHKAIGDLAEVMALQGSRLQLLARIEWLALLEASTGD